MITKPHEETEHKHAELERGQVIPQQSGKEPKLPGDDKRPEDHRDEKQRLLEDRPFDYIERTRPEDPSGRPGQLTRDNVNPNIPSGKLGDPVNSGGIVDPKSLGMDQSIVGEKPPTALIDKPPQLQPEQRGAPADAKAVPQGPRDESINEPAGSNVYSKPVPPAPEGLGKPVISSIEPMECAIGDPDFTLDVTGENFFAGSIIFFAGHDEPTSFDGTDTLSTGIKPSLWTAPVVVQCQVKNGSVLSDPVDFTFLAAGGTRSTDPDELEEELDEAEDDGDFKSTHKAKTRPKAKR